MLVALALGLTALAAPGDARAAPALFNKIKDVLVGHVNPDQIEMAKFAIEHPEDAAVVFDHAVAEDIPFFALVGAAKAAKGKDFPKLGTFNYTACVYPVTAVDEVFASADSKIDDAAGKNETNTVVGMAKSYSADAAKQGTQAAKDALNKQLIESIPYFGQIETICTFAFETEFSTERNIQLMVSDTARKVADAYDELSSGDVVSGVATLISLGVSSSLACNLVDDAVGGGVIGRTPLLGDLVKGACKSFVGKVLDGAAGLVKGGLGAAKAIGGFAYDSAKAAYCEAKSWFGGDCGSDPPPPTAVSEGVAFCASHGMTEHIDYQIGNAPDYFDAYCNDGTQLKRRPGQPPETSTPAQRAAALEVYKAHIHTEVLAGIEGIKVKWLKTWIVNCPPADPSCVSELDGLRQSVIAEILDHHAKAPLDDFWEIKRTTNYYLRLGDADIVLERAKFRTLPGQWAAAYLAYWGAKCEDNTCRTALKLQTYGTLLSVDQTYHSTYGLYEQIATPRYAEAAGVAATLIAESTARINDFNKKNTAEAAAEWEIVTRVAWGKQCTDDQCLAEVKQLAAQLRVAANLVQAGQPDLSSLGVQNIVGPEYGKKFKAAVDASKARTNAKVVAAAATQTSFWALHPTAPKAPRGRWVPFSARGKSPSFAPPNLRRPVRRILPGAPVQGTGGRPAPTTRPVLRPVPALSPTGARPAPIVIAPRVVPAPATGGRPAPRVAPTPVPTPTPTPTPGGRPPPIKRP